MYQILNHRINLDHISRVEIGEEAVKLNGTGVEVLLDVASTETSALLTHLQKTEGWLVVNGHLVNPKHIVTMNETEEGYLKVNVAGLEIWVPNEPEQVALKNWAEQPAAA